MGKVKTGVGLAPEARCGAVPGASQEALEGDYCPHKVKASCSHQKPVLVNVSTNLLEDESRLQEDPLSQPQNKTILFAIDKGL